MGIFKLERSICGLSLETGTKIIIYTSMFVNLLCLSSPPISGYNGYSNYMSINDEGEIVRKTSKLWDTTQFKAHVPMAVISIALDMLALFGIYEQRSELLFPFIVWYSWNAISYSLVMILFNFLLVEYEQFSLALLIATVSIILIQFYLILVITSLCRKIRAGRLARVIAAAELCNVSSARDNKVDSPPSYEDATQNFLNFSG